MNDIKIRLQRTPLEIEALLTTVTYASSDLHIVAEAISAKADDLVERQGYNSVPTDAKYDLAERARVAATAIHDLLKELYEEARRIDEE